MKRIQLLRRRFADSGIDALLVAGMSNIRYLSGFASDEAKVALMLITADQHYLITDYRFAEQAMEECADTEVVVRDRNKQTVGQLVRQLAADNGVTRLGFERDHFGYGPWQDLKADLGQLSTVSVRGQVELLRRIKDEFELDSMRRAAAIGDRALDDLFGLLRPGMTEREAAIELEYALLRAGSEGRAFPTIFTSGPRTSRPHGMPSGRRLARGDLVTVDFGAVVDGYRSDMTRSFAIGKADARQHAVYETVREAQALGVASVYAGIPYSQPYNTVADFLAKTEFAQYAGEGLGHALGLDTHERPYLAAGSGALLEENHVVTVEPGIYMPGWGGVRIEDDVRVTETGAERLTKFNRELIELD